MKAFKLIFLCLTILVSIGFVFHMHSLDLGEFVWMLIMIGMIWGCSKMNVGEVLPNLEED